MKAVQVSSSEGEFEIVDRPIPQPEADEVRVKVDACGICYSDSFVKDGNWPGLEYPRIPGHEVAGQIDAVGSAVTSWSEGQRVGVGWHGYHCFTCDPCRRGKFIDCEEEQVTGIDTDGGYAEYMTAPAHSLAKIPNELDTVNAAPLMCAGVSTFNPLQDSSTGIGDIAAILGLGGLGHLGVQFAAAAGFETIAISRGTEKQDLAFDLGADHYIDTEATDPAKELIDLGGADVIVATAPSSDAIEDVLPGLAIDGQLFTLGVPADTIDVGVLNLIDKQCSLKGWASGTARDSQDTLEFSTLRDITPMVETYSLEEVETAYEHMMANDVRFRAVLIP